MHFSVFGFPVEIQPTAFVLAGVVLLFGINSGQPMYYLLALILVGAVSILVHELGHALSASAFRAGPISITLHGMGGATRHRRTGTWWKELLVILAGPFAGFVLAAFLLPLYLFVPLPDRLLMLVELGVSINIAWGIFNLLPVYPMDGGQALAYGLHAVTKPVNAWLVAHVVGVALAVLLALYAATSGRLFIAMIVTMFAYQNVQGFQRVWAIRNSGRRG